VALWRLPRPDFHRLVDTDFQDTPLTLRPARSRSRQATLYIESSDSFVASAADSIATGWSEQVPGRESHPLKSSTFLGARLRQLPPEWPASELLGSTSGSSCGAARPESAAGTLTCPGALPSSCRKLHFTTYSRAGSNLFGSVSE